MGKGSWEPNVDREGYTVMYRCVKSRWDESSGEALTPCNPTMGHVDDLELQKLAEVEDIRCVQYHCAATIVMVLDKRGLQP